MRRRSPRKSWPLETTSATIWKPSPEMTEGGAEVSPTLAERVAQQGLPEWQQQQLLVADAVEIGYGERFVAVPQVESGEAYRDMDDFIATVRRPHLRELLDVAIIGRGAFRRFKDVLYTYPHEEKHGLRSRKTGASARPRVARSA